ncbi:MAG: Ppx/GppA family phosphatase [Solirubrobacterales bacterium]|nr:Ppx/GppA family phosphatase [Solirubrobacterales bacterium]
MATEGRRLAVIDLGSNSFRLVVFDVSPRGSWRRTDEIYETVRIGEGLGATGQLGEAAMDRALHTLELYAHFCRSMRIEDVRPVATSAIRDAENRQDFLKRAEAATDLPIRVLSGEEEARYGYLAAVNSTTLADGLVLDLGGGSLQLVRVAGRESQQGDSWRLGAVRMSEQFLPGEGRATRKALKALTAHVRAELKRDKWVRGAGERMVGIGGTVRNLAAAVQHASGVPDYGIQGFVLTTDALEDLVAELAGRTVAERGGVAGIKPGRADVILAGAVVVQTAMDLAGASGIEATEAGLREGVFLEHLLAAEHPPLFASVRDASVRNLALTYHEDLAHPEHVARLALRLWDALAEAGAHAGDPDERELLGAAAMLHDIGMAIDYDDHHKHSRYLIRSAAPPGFDPRERALLGQIVRYHRKGDPSLGEAAALAGPGDYDLVRRCTAILRVVENLERSRDQLVRDIDVRSRNGRIELRLRSDGDDAVARWGAERQSRLFERAFGRELELA